MKIELPQNIKDEVRSKVKAYAKIISGQSNQKTPPNGINLLDVEKFYVNKTVVEFVNIYKLPRVSARRFAKAYVGEYIKQCIRDVNY
jgi:hypothetical protein